MSIIEKKEMKIISNFNCYITVCNKMRKLQKADFQTIQRTVSPYCKTSTMGKKTLVIKLKGNIFGISITKLSKEPYETVDYYLIIAFPFNVSYTISADNIYELMQKINHTHKLIKPDFRKSTQTN